MILAYLETRFYLTKNPVFASACQLRTKIFVLNFAIGVSSGIVMEFQFGTNWATYSRFVGDVFGSALAAEGIFAFFLESGFLAIVAFGRSKVSAGLYLFSMYMVASLGLALNGHMQAQNIYKYQPAKLASFEGHYTTGRADLNLIGWPDERDERIDYVVSIPGGLSFMVFDDFTFSKPVVGLD